MKQKILQFRLVLQKGTCVGIYKLCSTMILVEIIHQSNNILDDNTWISFGGDNKGSVLLVSKEHSVNIVANNGYFPYGRESI